MSIQLVSPSGGAYASGTERVSTGQKAAVGTVERPVASPPTEVKQDAARQRAEAKPSSEQLKEVVADMNKSIRQSNSNLQFSIDSDTQRSVVKLLDGETGDVIRQFPSEETLAISRSIEQMQKKGALLSVQA